MITPDQAFEIIFRHSFPRKTISINLLKCSGIVLAEDVHSGDHLPRFNNSAMDGYAVRAEDIKNARPNNPISLKLIGEIHAGSAPRLKLKKDTAIRISTGAAIPSGADAVVMQEFCQKNGNEILVKDHEPLWGNIRKKGEEIRKGQIALRKGIILNPGSIAWLHTMGIQNVSVFRPLKIGLLRTGNEIYKKGMIQSHQIRDAHGVSLKLALQDLGLEAVVPPIVPDKFEQVVRNWKRLLEECDIVITTGGVSVGERDLFAEAAKRLKIKVLFHNISQKPGKPMAFGKFKNKLWFGLPGNPVSALVCFYLYIQPALKRMLGYSHFRHQWHQTKTAQAIQANPSKTLFLRASVCDSRIEIAEKQGSHCLGRFANANAILRIEPSDQKLKKNSHVSYLPLF
jgi:molybdopterin molybdotransferase